jgi:hypothetical protein
VACAVSRFAQSVFSEVGIAHAYSSFLCTLYTVSLCNSLFKNALPAANVALLDSAYALKLINEVRIISSRVLRAVVSRVRFRSAPTLALHWHALPETEVSMKTLICR